MIRLRLSDDMSLCTDAEVERMLPLVPEPRRSQAMAFKHTFGRYASLKSYLMLASLLKETFGVEHVEMAVGGHGKPYLADRPDIHFSISHCKDAIAVAVSDRPVGIDAESLRSFSDSLLDKTMNPAEKAQILSSPNPQETFISYWTRKEAVFKLMGTGITDNLHGILTDKTKTDTVVNPVKGYAVSVAMYSRDFPDQLCWP